MTQNQQVSIHHLCFLIIKPFCSLVQSDFRFSYVAAALNSKIKPHMSTLKKNRGVGSLKCNLLRNLKQDYSDKHYCYQLKMLSVSRTSMFSQ